MIGGVVLAWVLVVALLLALPALAWWVGGREGWNRPSPAARPDLYREMVRRHGLRPAEAAEVEAAVTWGRELQDPRLRTAVVDWAGSLQAAAAAHRTGGQWRRPLAVALLVVAAIGWVALVVTTAGWGFLGVMVLLELLLIPMSRRLAGGPARAVRRNSGPVPT